jgi:hypothetical protein
MQGDSVFSVYIDGSLSINFGNMDKIFSMEEITAFRLELSAISTFENILVPDNYCYINITSAFPSPEYLKRFQEIDLRLKEQIDI